MRTALRITLRVFILVGVVAFLTIGVRASQTSSDRLRAIVADLSSADPARRGAALIALRDVHDPAGVPALTRALVTAQPPALDTIIEALALFPDPRKIAALIVLAHRFEASRNERLADQFRPLGAAGARALIDAVAVCGDVGDMHLATFNEWAATTAGEVGDTALPVLREAAKSSDRCSRWAAMLALGRYAWDTECRWGVLCEARTLLERGQRDADAHAAEAATRGLEDLDEPIHEIRDPDSEDVPTLTSAERRTLASRNPDERIRALEDLGGRWVGRAPAAAALADPDERVRLAAVAALVEIDEQRRGLIGAGPATQLTVDALIRAIDDRSAAVRAAVADALGRVADVSGTFSHRPDEGPPPTEVAALIRHLTDSSEKVRAAASEALGVLRVPAAVGQMIALLQGRDAGTVRSQAAHALGFIGDPQAAGPLADALKDVDVGVNLRRGCRDRRQARG